MKIDVSKLSSTELESLITSANQALEIQKKEALDTIIQKVKDLAVEANLSTEQLMTLVVGAKRNAGKPVQPKYKHPSEDLKWTGRGRKPAWVQELLDAGSSLEELLIP